MFIFYHKHRSLGARDRDLAFTLHRHLYKLTRQAYRRIIADGVGSLPHLSLASC